MRLSNYSYKRDSSSARSAREAMFTLRSKMAAQTPWHEYQKKGYELEKQMERLKKKNAEVEKGLKNKIESDVVFQGGYPPVGFYGAPFQGNGKIRM